MEVILHSPSHPPIPVPQSHSQPQSRPPAGVHLPSLPFIPGDSIDPHGRSNFPPSCRPSQPPTLLAHPHSFVSAPITYKQVLSRTPSGHSGQGFRSSHSLPCNLQPSHPPKTQSQQQKPWKGKPTQQRQGQSMPLISAFGRLWQADLCESEAILAYVVSSSIATDT